MCKKCITIILCLIIFAAVLFAIFYYVRPYYQSWKIGHDYQKFENAYIDYFKNDIYGGKTPQETYNMYLDALKKGNVELASRYFFWKNQNEQKQKLTDLKTKGELQNYINGLPKWEELKEEEYWDKDGKQYSYEFVREKDEKYFDDLLQKEDVLKAGKYRASVIFQINTYANIWKIYSL